MWEFRNESHKARYFLLAAAWRTTRFLMAAARQSPSFLGEPTKPHRDLARQARKDVCPLRVAGALISHCHKFYKCEEETDSIYSVGRNGLAIREVRNLVRPVKSGSLLSNGTVKSQSSGEYLWTIREEFFSLSLSLSLSGIYVFS